MAQYIDKSTIKTELESKRKYAQCLGDNAIYSSMQQFYDGMKQGCVDLLSFLDTLEVKRMDLEKEIDDYINEHFSECEDGVLISDANSKELTLLDAASIARHFFELGLKAQKL